MWLAAALRETVFGGYRRLVGLLKAAQEKEKG